MLPPWAAHWITAALLCRAVAQYSSDQCSWRGSGLSHESHRRDVEQVYLRCSQGSLEWLYPTGAIIINLRPNTEPASGHMAGLHVCIKPHTHSQGSHVYLEHNGDLRMLVAEKDQAQGTVQCFSLAEGALFVEAVPQADISRRITAFQYELVSSQGPGAHLYPYLHPGLEEPKPLEKSLNVHGNRLKLHLCLPHPRGSQVSARPKRRHTLRQDGIENSEKL